MRRFWFICLGWGCVGLAAPALPQTGDPPRIERTIRKEPIYTSKTPKYCLLTLGPKSETRIWVVLDGDVFYVDHNGNGDLTETIERIPIEHKTKETDLDGKPFFTTPLFGEEVADGQGRRQVDFSFEYSPDNRLAACSVVVRSGKLPKLCQAVMADRPQDAEVLQLDGPLSFDIAELGGPPLVRGKEPKDLCVCIGTFGPKTSALIQVKDVPADVHPLAEIEFPSKQPGGQPILVKVVLDRRC